MTRNLLRELDSYLFDEIWSMVYHSYYDEVVSNLKRRFLYDNVVQDLKKRFNYRPLPDNDNFYLGYSNKFNPSYLKHLYREYLSISMGWKNETSVNFKTFSNYSISRMGTLLPDGLRMSHWLKGTMSPP
jgi:hypothetical protein